MWLSVLLSLVLVICFTIWLYKYMTYRPKNFPPGPLRLPIWGTYPFVLLHDWNFPQVALQRWAKRYGNIIGFYLGDLPVVVVNDYDTVKEVLTRIEFDGKPQLLTARLRALHQDLGIFFVDGPFWHEQRRFSLRYLRDFGFGRRFEKLERLMEDQIQHVVDFMRDRKPAEEDKDILRNDSVLFPDVLYPTMLNSIMSIFGTEPAEFGTSRYRYLRHVGRGVIKLQRGLFPMPMLSVKPWTRYFAPNIIGYTNLLESNDIIHPYIKECIDESKETLLEDEVRNFFDMYLHRLKEEEKEEVSTFSEQQLHMITVDYMFPAASAVSATFVYIIEYMLNYPEIQEKMQREIDDVVGRGRLPTLDDRINLPYVEATIREVMRKDTFVPLGVPRKTLEDVTLKGYDIPKDTIVYTSLHGAHNDKKIWGDPENFRPERFIDSSGHLVKKDYSLPFGAGKRLCAGETFARHSLFLITACMVQNFTFKVPKGRPMPKLENKCPGLVNLSKNECWVEAVPRN